MASTDNIPHVIVVCWSSDPGVKQVFGPFSGRAEAERAMADVSAWPVFDSISSGEWSVMPCTPLIAPVPPVVVHPAGYFRPRTPGTYPAPPFTITCDTGGVNSGAAA